MAQKAGVMAAKMTASQNLLNSMETVGIAANIGIKHEIAGEI